MRFEVLGPLRVRDGDSVRRVGGPREQKVLAVLLLAAGRPASQARLASAVWGDAPPATAKAQIHNSIAALRRAFGPDVQISRAGAGFILNLAGHELDLAEFNEKVADAQRLVDLASARERLRAALALWHGPALSGLADGILATEAGRLEELRLACLERCLVIELELGNHAELIAELRQLVAEYPLRETLHTQLMVALHRFGRRGEALQAYRELRRVLANELGLEPDPATQQLHQELLRGAGSDWPPDRSSGVPAELPPDIADFIGRADALVQLDTQLSHHVDGHSTALTLITGAAGIGKTALAVHWAHRVAEHFPDGQLYADLHGYHPAPPLRPIDLLARFLRALGVRGADVPVDLDAAAAGYRSLLADKRVLVVLDNAASAEQVRPLLPGGAACMALITSREELGGLIALDGARRLVVDVFSADEASALLSRVVGTSRTDSESAATAELGRRCGYLPLALRIAAANLAGRPDRRIIDHVAELATAGELAGLRIAGDERADVRTAFDYSYRPLDAYTRRVFRLLSLLPGPDFTAAAATSLVSYPAGLTEQALQTLAARHLIQRHRGGRFALHDLLRQYATERAAAEETPPERQAAMCRLLGWYLAGADRAAREIYPDARRLPEATDSTPRASIRLQAVPPTIADRNAAFAWLHNEQVNLVAAIQHAAEHGPHEFAYRLADTLTGYFRIHNQTTEWLAAGQAGLRAAIHAGDQLAEAAMHNMLGMASRAVGDYGIALQHYNHALARQRAVNARDAQSDTLTSAALVRWEQGELHAAVHDLTHALALHRELGNDAGQARALDNLACLYYELGRIDQAVAHDSQALVIFQRLGVRSDEANTLGNLAQFYQELGCLDQAFDLLNQALTLREHMRSRDSEASILDALAAAHRDAGHYNFALDYAQQCLTLAESAGLRRALIEVHNTIGSVYAAAGDYPNAVDHHATAVKIAREMGYRRGEVQGLTGLASGHCAMNLLNEAADQARQALQLARQCSYRLLEGRAQKVLADVEIALGHPDNAVEHCRDALSIHRETGHQLGQAQTLRTLANALRATGNYNEADDHRRKAEALLAAIASTNPTSR